MVYRNSWLAGFAALIFAFFQLNGLIRSTADGVAWQYIVIAALVLGMIITWTALTYRLKTWIVVLLNAGAALIAVVRVVAPETTAFFLPTPDSLSRLGTQFDSAQELIRTGVEPVVPEAGVVVVVMLVLWAVGALLSWGLLRGHPYVALLPPLVLSLQFATMDRRPTSALTIAIFIALVAVIIFAVTADERDQTAGRMAPRGRWASDRNRPGPAAAGLLIVTVIGSVFVVRAVDATVPHDGILDWRVDSGLPSNVYGGGGVSYNAFSGISQRLVNGSDTPVFLASIVSEVPVEEVFFRFMTLENYDGSKFSLFPGDLNDLDDDVWELPEHQFAGPTEPLATAVVIDQLEMEWLPTPAVPFAVEGDGTFDAYLRVRPEDAAILYRGGRTSYEMTYRVWANIPRPDLDVLATIQSGESAGQLSIAFRTAQQDASLPPGVIPEPKLAALVRAEPPNPERFLGLPDNDPAARIPVVRTLAQQVTANLDTPFERGLALESFLRTFTYKADIQPDQSAEELSAWLLDEGSPNYRQGYCENFSTALAVMARTLGIHSRVVLGFTPGEKSLIQGPNVVVVRDRNAHAWVELWMPSQGWVRFDPTPRSDAINPSTAGLVENRLDFAITDYLVVEAPPPAPGGGGLVGPPRELEEDFVVLSGGDADVAVDPGFILPVWVLWTIPLLALIVLLAGGVPALKSWRHRRRLGSLRNGDITAAWEDIVVRLGDLGRAVSPTHTPAEVAVRVDDSMVPLATVYGKAVYGPPNGSASETDVAVAEASLLETREHLISITTRRRRLIALYRPGAGFTSRVRGRRRRT